MSDESIPMLPPLDNAKAEQMIGKVVLVGITRYGGDGQMRDQQQYSGTVLRISAEEGVVLADEDDGHEHYLPPMLDQYRPAEPVASHAGAPTIGLARPNSTASTIF